MGGAEGKGECLGRIRHPNRNLESDMIESIFGIKLIAASEEHKGDAEEDKNGREGLESHISCAGAESGVSGKVRRIPYLRTFTFHPGAFTFRNGEVCSTI